MTPIPHATRRLRRGVTLVELIVVITTMAFIAGVAALAMPRRIVPPDDTEHRIANARTKALELGQPVRVTLHLTSGFAVATALPDGTVLADSGAHVDRLTGRTTMKPDSARAPSVTQ